MNLNLHRVERYRAVFLSDFHMGAKAFDARALLDFLKSMECQYLFLAGDIIDGWKLKKRWHWTENCNRIIDELLRKAQSGTKIIYLPGNHDDEVRDILPPLRQRFAHKIGISIKEKTIHKLLDGRRFLVMHGDQFDRKILRGPLSRWSDRLYDTLMDFLGAHEAPTIVLHGKRKPFSLAKYLAKHSKRALHLLNNFENAAFRIASQHHVDGLICGHTHIPVIKCRRGITYANAGSWLRTGHTALVEKLDGALALIDWPSSMNQPTLFDPLFQQEPESFRLIPAAGQYRITTNRIVREIRRLWPERKPRPAAAPIAAPRNSTTAFTTLHHSPGGIVHKTA